MFLFTILALCLNFQAFYCGYLDVPDDYDFDDFGINNDIDEYLNPLYFEEEEPMEIGKIFRLDQYDHFIDLNDIGVKIEPDIIDMLPAAHHEISDSSDPKSRDDSSSRLKSNEYLRKKRKYTSLNEIKLDRDGKRHILSKLMREIERILDMKSNSNYFDILHQLISVISPRHADELPDRLSFDEPHDSNEGPRERSKRRMRETRRSQQFMYSKLRRILYLPVSATRIEVLQECKRKLDQMK